MSMEPLNSSIVLEYVYEGQQNQDMVKISHESLDNPQQNLDFYRSILRKMGIISE